MEIMSGNRKLTENNYFPDKKFTFLHFDLKSRIVKYIFFLNLKYKIFGSKLA